MRFMYEDEFNPKPGRLRELRGWLADHDEKLRLACPCGVVYVGAFSVVHSTAQEAPDVRVEWAMDSRAAMAAFEAAIDEPGLLRQLVDELHDFAAVPARGAWPAQTLLTSLVSTV